MRLERRANVPLYLMIVAPICAIFMALFLAAGLILAAGVNPLTAYAEMLTGALGSRLSITEMLTRATPLILTGLAAAVAFRARLWNIGAEGQFFAGALITAAIGHSLGVPGWIGIPILMIAGMIAGALLLAGPAFLRLRFGVDEVVTTLLLNFIVILFVGLMIEGPMRDPFAFGWPSSVPVDGAFRLPDLIPKSRLHIGLLFAIAAAGAVWVVLTRHGFRGRNPRGGTECTRSSLCRDFTPAHDYGRRAVVRRFGRIGRVDRGYGRHRRRDHHDEPRFRICRDHCGDAGGTSPRRCCRLGDICGDGFCRRRCDEPRNRRPQLYRRCHRRLVSFDHDRGPSFHNL